MYAKRLRLTDFRNYRTLDIALSPHINILYGDNGQGKTNILEAIYMCATGKSHRTTNEKECIRLGEELAAVQIEYQSGLYTDTPDATGREESLGFEIKRSGKRRYFFNCEQVPHMSDVFGQLKLVLFSPEDLQLIKKGPELRRRFMDMEICQVDKTYLYHLQRYRKVLAERGEILKKCYTDSSLRELLSSYDEQLAREALPIQERRARFIEDITPIASGIYTSISSDAKTMSISYENSATNVFDDYVADLFEDREMDIRYGNTSIGPHKDDLKICLDEDDTRKFASQGQQRTCALALKFAELELIRRECGEAPLLLLDDVMSELDAERQKKLLQYVQESQTFISCTELDENVTLPNNVETKYFKIQDGCVV